MQQLAIHDLDTWLKPTGFYKDIQWLIQEGYGFDYLSDQFLEKITVEKGNLKLPGGSYKALLIPKTKHLPMASLEKLIALKKAGAHILFEDLPQTVPGFKNYQEETAKMQVLLDANKLTTTPSKAWDSILIQSGAKPEKWVNTGLKYIRRKWNNETLYYIVNHTSSTIQEWLPWEFHQKMLQFLIRSAPKRDVPRLKKLMEYNIPE